MAFNFGQQPAFGAQGAAASGPPTPPIGSGAFPAVGGAIGAQLAFGAQGQAAPGLPPPAFGFGAAVPPPTFSQPVASIGGFGQPNAPFAPAPAPGFGQPSGTGFCIAAPQGGMGVASFPAAQAGFGAAAAAVGFGAQTAFGAAPAATAFGASSFGGAPASSGFGSTAFGAASQTFIQNSGGFQGQQGNFQKQDKSDGQVNSICANMRDQCLESQRFLDYQQGKKGPAQQQAFGAPVGAVSGVMDRARQADAEKFHALVERMTDCDLQRIRNAASGFSKSEQGLNMSEIVKLLAPLEHLDFVTNGQKNRKQIEHELTLLLEYLGLL